jgi:hypothetical protein
VLATVTFAAAGKILPASHPFMRLLGDVSVERGREHRAILVVPIARAFGDPAGLVRPRTSVEAVRQELLSAAEPAKNPGRGPVELFNWSKDRILVLAGEVFEGGIRDRFVARDVLLGPASRAVAPGYPADRKPRPAADAKTTLAPLAAVAPDLLRLLGMVEGPLGAADSFLQDEYALAGEKDPRETLVHLMRSEQIAARMDEYRNMFAKIPAEAGGKAIGAAVLVGDRLLSVDLFATNDMFAAHWPMLLTTCAFQASLYEVSYGLLNQPFPAARDPARYARMIEQFLKIPFAARFMEEPAVALGTEMRFERDRTVGRVLLDGENFLHAVLSFDVLTSSADAPPPPPSTSGVDPGAPELERRAARSRLTEYERRLLERMRDRRQGALPGGRLPGPDGTGATGGDR